MVTRVLSPILAASIAWLRVPSRQKRRPVRPPNVNGVAVHLGRTAVHVVSNRRLYKNQPNVTQLPISDLWGNGSQFVLAT